MTKIVLFFKCVTPLDSESKIQSHFTPLKFIYLFDFNYVPSYFSEVFSVFNVLFHPILT